MHIRVFTSLLPILYLIRYPTFCNIKSTSHYNIFLYFLHISILKNDTRTRDITNIALPVPAQRIAAKDPSDNIAPLPRVLFADSISTRPLRGFLCPPIRFSSSLYSFPSLYLFPRNLSLGRAVFVSTVLSSHPAFYSPPTYPHSPLAVSLSTRE